MRLKCFLPNSVLTIALDFAVVRSACLASWTSVELLSISVKLNNHDNSDNTHATSFTSTYFMSANVSNSIPGDD